MQMQQSIKLLQMTSAELEQAALDELVQNPFLEFAEDSDDDDASAPDLRSETDGDPRADSDAYEDAGGIGDVDGALSPTMAEAASEANAEVFEGNEPAATLAEPEAFDKVDINWDDLYDGSENKAYGHHDSSEEDDERDPFETVAAPESLYQRLMGQLRSCPMSDADRLVGQEIIGNLDDDGYLRTPIEEIAQELRCSTSEVERVLGIVQSFEPAGVGARSVQECLSIQLRNQGERDKRVFRVLDEKFDLLKKRDFRSVARDLGLEKEFVAGVFEKITHLDPKPGLTVSANPVHYVVPDVVVVRVDGRYMVYLSDGRLGGLRINSQYRDLLRDGQSFSGGDLSFVQDKFKSAMWLLKSIEKRRNTILRVTEAIVAFQKDFLDKGIRFLRPLRMREVADAVGMHESTVARTVAGKYVDTPRGIYELRSFFTTGLRTESGEDTSNASVKDMIAQIIAAETPGDPVTDQALTAMLHAKGIEIARRTVAKYREQLKILKASVRRQTKG